MLSEILTYSNYSIGFLIKKNASFTQKIEYNMRFLKFITIFYKIFLLFYPFV